MLNGKITLPDNSQGSDLTPKWSLGLEHSSRKHLLVTSISVSQTSSASDSQLCVCSGRTCASEREKSTPSIVERAPGWESSRPGFESTLAELT